MCCLEKNDEFLDKDYEIWNKFSNTIKTRFENEPV